MSTTPSVYISCDGTRANGKGCHESFEDLGRLGEVREAARAWGWKIGRGRTLDTDFCPECKAESKKYDWSKPK